VVPTKEASTTMTPPPL